MLVAARSAIFFLMAYVVNPPLRDDAIYNAVIKTPAAERSSRGSSAPT